jgi:hypothetical protein
MSLDVYLRIAVPIDPDAHNCNCEHCEIRPTGFETVFDRNTTHNHNRIADAVGIYRHCWRPDEIGVTTASQLIEPLRAGLAQLRATPEAFKHLEPGNGWGSVAHFTDFVAAYLEACEAHPTATVSVSR